MLTAQSTTQKFDPSLSLQADFDSSTAAVQGCIPDSPTVRPGLCRKDAVLVMSGVPSSCSTQPQLIMCAVQLTIEAAQISYVQGNVGSCSYWRVEL